MGRLFWKFFVFILLAQLAAILAIGGAVWLEESASRKTERVVDLGPPAVFLVSAAAATLEHGGIDALRALLSMPNQPLVYALDESNRELLNRNVSGEMIAQAQHVLADDTNSRVVRRIANAGQEYLLFAPSMGLDHGRGLSPGRIGRPSLTSFRSGPRRHRSPLPILPTIATVLGSLICAAMLARYLSKPIRSLRSAFDAAGAGNLNLRVGPLMNKRNDELAELGRDFDRMASQLREVMDRQRRLFHDVSHELRSPLARLQAAVGLARQQPETMRASLDRIEHEGERIDTLIGELLTLSKLEAGVIVSMDQDIDVNELVTEVIVDARFEANANSRVIVFDERCTVVVKGQWELLHRAVENIVRNALKHTQQHIHVRLDIATDANGSKAHIVVTDEGPGVPEQELTEIFAPFFRSAGSTHTYGHGLGLAIARRVAEAHGGTINASNCTAGGLRVEMVLPIKNKLSIASLACGSSSVLSA